VWVRSAAIRPIPPYAELSEEALTAVEDWFADEDEQAEERFNTAFERFERAQPELAAQISETLNRTSDEVAVALGYFLSLVIWLGFDHAFGPKLSRLTRTEIDGVAESLDLDEQLRGEDPAEAVDSDDVVAMEQPHVLQFVHEHVDAALESHGEQADVDAVHEVYRMLLVEVLALSYAVAPPKNFVGTSSEICA